jgi:hypothetical protein
MVDVTEIEKRVDRAIAAPIPITGEGFDPRTWGEAMEAAKLMAVSGAAVPRWLRGNPGGCFAVCMRAKRWGMDPFGVAEKTYVVMNRGEERIAYEAQLIHAVITSRGNLQGRLRHEIIGDGDERRCKVWGTFKGEKEPHVYLSETLRSLREARGRNEHGQVRGSQLWDQSPEVQLAYSSYRQWARLFASEVLLGVYAPDEQQDNREALDVTPATESKMVKALREARKARTRDRGFDHSHVVREHNSIIEGEATEESESEGSDEGKEVGTESGHEPSHNQDVERRDIVGNDQGGETKNEAGSVPPDEPGNSSAPARSTGLFSEPQAVPSGANQQEGRGKRKV